MKAEELFQKLACTSGFMKKASDRMLSILDLTHGQAMILAFLFMNEGKKVTQKDVEKQFELSHATVNGFMNRMEKKGLLTVRQDESDRRFKVIVPTQKLLELYQLVRQRASDFSEHLNRKMSAEEQDMLISLLDKLMNIGKKHMETYEEAEMYKAMKQCGKEWLEA